LHWLLACSPCVIFALVFLERSIPPFERASNRLHPCTVQYSGRSWLARVQSRLCCESEVTLTGKIRMRFSVLIVRGMTILLTLSVERLMFVVGAEIG
jgi:hypothetical protein